MSLKNILIVAITLLGLFLLVPLTSMADHVSNTYEVNVTSSFGTQFSDCFRFDDPVSGDLTIDQLGSLTYAHGGLNSGLTRFKAVSRDDDFEIMFFGNFRSRGLTGEALNEFGDTFVFNGAQNAGCTVSTLNALESSNPYMK